MNLYNENDPNPAGWPVLTDHTPTTLLAHWKTFTQRRSDVIVFYQDGKGHPWREFSNWYIDKDGFDFVLPQQLLDVAGIPEDLRDELFPPVVHCLHSEKALMLCKAAAMGDTATYHAIVAESAPKECKQLGRRVANFNDERWQSVICGLAICILRQKFGPSAGAAGHLRDVLVQQTGNKILAEATAHDQTWANGVSIKMPAIYQIPARWKGSNVLGWALMQVRERIQAEQQAEKITRSQMFKQT